VDYDWGVGVGMGYTLLLEGDISSICKRLAMKKKIIKKIIIISIKNTHIEKCTRQSYLVLTHLSQGLVSSIFTTAPLWYFPGYFLLAFLEGCCPSLSPAVMSLCLDPMTWDPSALSNRVASSSNTLSWSCWRYSIILLFFFFSSATPYLLAFSQAFSSTSLLAF